jgi:hypothetical protein
MYQRKEIFNINQMILLQYKALHIIIIYNFNASNWKNSYPYNVILTKG